MTTAGDNPFRVARIEALPFRAPDFSWDDFLARLEGAGYRGAVVGPHGSGKTTLLVEARRRLEARGIPVAFHLLNDLVARKRASVRAWVRALPADTVLFLDGAEQLDWTSWQWLRWRSRRLRGLVVTLHRPGRLPAIYQTQSNETLLRALLAELAPESVDACWQRARALYGEYDGNIRDVFFALYDDCAGGRQEKRPG